MSAAHVPDLPLATEPRRPASAAGTDAERTDPAPSRWAHVGYLLVALLGFVGLVALTASLMVGMVYPFDQPWLDMALTLNRWPLVWEAFSQSANIPLIVIAVAFMLWLVRLKRHREAVLVFLILAAVTGGSEGVKQLVGRPRPYGNGDGIPGVIYGFPSGHVLESLTILGFVALRSWHSARSLWLRLALVVLVAIQVSLVGIARLALNAHYPTDLLAGLLGGFGALGLYGWFTRPGGWADKPPIDPARSRKKREAA